MAARYVSSSVIAFTLVLLAGPAVAQINQEELAAVKETVRQLTLRNPLYLELPEANNCKQLTLDFLLNCLEPVLPAISPRLGEALNQVANIDNSEGESSVVLDGGVLLGALDQDVFMVKSCCTPTCMLARNGCGCNDIVFRNLVQLVGGDEAIAREFIRRVAVQCVADNPNMSFESTLNGSDQCKAEFEPIASAFLC